MYSGFLGINFFKKNAKINGEQEKDCIICLTSKEHINKCILVQTIIVYTVADEGVVS